MHGYMPPDAFMLLIMHAAADAAFAILLFRYGLLDTLFRHALPYSC